MIIDDLHIVGIVPCVGYADFLRCTLPLNSKQLDEIIVLSDNKDDSTHKICVPHSNVRCVSTDVWYLQSNGQAATFNKGRGLNVGIDEIWSKCNHNTWICAMDADIILPDNFKKTLNGIEIDTLYSCRRKLCESPNNYSTNWDTYKLEPLPRYSPDTGMWGNAKLRTGNAAGLYGYLQMWSCSLNARFPTQYAAAHSYDVRFGMGWPDDKRKWLPCEVLHLGYTRTNWNGRISSKWKPAG